MHYRSSIVPPCAPHMKADVAVTRRFLTLLSFVFSYCKTTRTMVLYVSCAKQQRCLHTFLWSTRKIAAETSTSCVLTSAAAAAAARSPQPINRAALAAVGSCCRPFDLATHNFMSCILLCKSRAGGIDKSILKYTRITCRSICVLISIDKQVTPISGKWAKNGAVTGDIFQPLLYKVRTAVLHRVGMLFVEVYT